MPPSKGILYMLLLLRDCEYTGIWGLLNRILEKPLAEAQVLLLDIQRRFKALERKKIPVVVNVLHGSLIFFTSPVLLPL
jgi:hypothetical protein